MAKCRRRPGRWGRGAAAALALVAAGSGVPAARGAEPIRDRQIEADYIVTWLGLPVYSARLQARWNDTAYRMRLQAQPEGIARLGSNTTLAWETTGRIEGAQPRPARLEQANTWRRQTRAITLAYDAGGTPAVSVVPPESPGKRPPVPDALKAQTLDPLSAVFAALAASPRAEGCVFAAKVFDGLRRTDIRLEPAGRQRTPDTFVSGLPREALLCRLHAKRLAGYEEKHFRNNPEPLPPAEVSIVKHPDTGHWLLVQVRFESAYGPVYARLARFGTGKGVTQ